MVRDSTGDERYWDKWVAFDQKRTEKELDVLSKPSANPIYRPQFAFDTSLGQLKKVIRGYSQGEDVSGLHRALPLLLGAWEVSNKISAEVCFEKKLISCRDWVFDLKNLNHYNFCFGVVALALVLDAPNDQWERLVSLVGGEGEDVLLDRIIATRQPDREIGTVLLHPKPYARLLKAINAPKDQQAQLLLEFVENWYSELARKGKDALWWYDYGDPVKHPLEKGSYFGRWCVEAVAAVKAFGIDDSLCLGHENYPGDLLRPNGPTTHKLRAEERKGWLSRLFGK